MKNIAGISVKELMKIDLLREAKLLAGEGGMEEIISSVNVMEVPDIMNWVKKGEFLLTTAYSIRDDVTALNKIIPRMKKIGVCGIGIKTKRYITKLPESVLNTADEFKFPVVQIPFDVSYGDLITHTLTSIVNKQTKFLSEMDSFNNLLRETMLKDGELEEIAGVISSFAKAPVAISNDIFKEYTLFCDDADLKKELSKETEKIVYRKENNNIEQQRKSKNYSYYSISIFNDHVFYGNVIIWDINNKVDRGIIKIVESSTSLIALNISKKLSVYENENKHRIEFLESLLSKDEATKLKALERSIFFDFKKEACFCCLVAVINSAIDDIYLTSNNTQLLKFLSNKLVTCINRMKYISDRNFIYGNKSDRAVFLVEFNRDASQDDVRKEMTNFANEFYNCAKLEGISEKLIIGIGRGYSDFRKLDNSFSQALQVIKKMQINKGEDFFMHFDDLGIYKILANESIQSELMQFSREVLDVFIQYDELKNTGFIETLRMYFECGGNLKKVSNRLYTHYNTIIYRIGRIQEIGGIDLTDSQTALNLQLALKIMDFLG